MKKLILIVSILPTSTLNYGVSFKLTKSNKSSVQPIQPPVILRPYVEPVQPPVQPTHLLAPLQKQYMLTLINRWNKQKNSYGLSQNEISQIDNCIQDLNNAITNLPITLLSPLNKSKMEQLVKCLHNLIEVYSNIMIDKLCWTLKK